MPAKNDRLTCSLRSLLLLLLALGGLATAGPVAEPPRGPEEWEQAAKRLHQGATAAEVREALGLPRRVARQVLYHRVLEQWYYIAPLPARLEVEVRRGQPGRLTGWQLLRK